MSEEVRSQPSCADVSDPFSLSVAQAQDAIRRTLVPIHDREQVSIRAALGRVLAAYESNRGAETETVELKLSEAALKEMPAHTPLNQQSVDAAMARYFVIAVKIC